MAYSELILLFDDFIFGNESLQRLGTAARDPYSALEKCAKKETGEYGRTDLAGMILWSNWFPQSDKVVLADPRNTLSTRSHAVLALEAALNWPSISWP